MIGRLFHLLGDQRGVVALEFAIVTPILLTMLVGGVELTYTLLAEAKLRTMAYGFANLVAKQASLDSATLTDICSGGQLMLYPLPATEMSVAVASVALNGGNVVTEWQDTSCGSATGAITNPAASGASLLANEGDRAILVLASYRFRPPTHLFLPADLTLSEQAYARPYYN